MFCSLFYLADDLPVAEPLGLLRAGDCRLGGHVAESLAGEEGLGGQEPLFNISLEGTARCTVLLLAPAVCFGLWKGFFLYSLVKKIYLLA